MELKESKQLLDYVSHDENRGEVSSTSFLLSYLTGLSMSKLPHLDPKLGYIRSKSQMRELVYKRTKSC